MVLSPPQALCGGEPSRALPPAHGDGVSSSQRPQRDRPGERPAGEGGWAQRYPPAGERGPGAPSARERALPGEPPPAAMGTAPGTGHGHGARQPRVCSPRPASGPGHSRAQGTGPGHGAGHSRGSCSRRTRDHPSAATGRRERGWGGGTERALASNSIERPRFMLPPVQGPRLGREFLCFGGLEQGLPNTTAPLPTR